MEKIDKLCDFTWNILDSYDLSHESKISIIDVVWFVHGFIRLQFNEILKFSTTVGELANLCVRPTHFFQIKKKYETSRKHDLLQHVGMHSLHYKQFYGTLRGTVFLVTLLVFHFLPSELECNYEMKMKIKTLSDMRARQVQVAFDWTKPTQKSQWILIVNCNYRETQWIEILWKCPFRLNIITKFMEFIEV